MPLKHNMRDHDTEAGIALITVLWAITFLVLVALTFSNSVQIETRSMIYRKEAAQAHAMACGGVQAAILELAYTPVGNPSRPWLLRWQNGERVGIVPFAGGQAELLIVNESGKVDLNAADREQLMRLFRVRGVEQDTAYRLAEAVIRWRASQPADDREAEALEDYYQQAGYRPAHAPFTSVEQVLSVRGMTREFFYGTIDVSERGMPRWEYGVGRDLTVFSGSPAVNVNYASLAVLGSVQGFTADVAEAIVEERSRGPFQSMEDLNSRLAAALPVESLPFLTTTESKTYSIISVGEVAGSRVRRTVRAVVQLASQGTAQYRTLAWYDDDARG